MDIKAALGSRIRHLREKKGLSQSELAERVDRSVHAISMIERGRNWPNIATLDALGAALSVSPARLLTELEGPGETMKRDKLLAQAERSLRVISENDLGPAVAMLEALARRSG